MPLETYVARVLAGEAARGSGPAALEALAITIRTFALANRGRHRADGFDLCDLTHCQVVRTATAATEQAARATAGSVLLYRGAPAQVFYTASCGGRTGIAFRRLARRRGPAVPRVARRSRRRSDAVVVRADGRRRWSGRSPPPASAAVCARCASRRAPAPGAWRSSA